MIDAPQDPTAPMLPGHRVQLRSHFGLTRAPFNKAMRARQMFESKAQFDVVAGLRLWTEIHGIGLLIGATGVGKSITVRRFVRDLDDKRFHVIRLAYLPATVNGFLRGLARVLKVTIHHRTADLYDEVKNHLVGYHEAHGPHPMLIIDDGEGLRPQILDVIRRLTCTDLDAKDAFSILLVGTEELSRTLRGHDLDAIRTRVTGAYKLGTFSLEDTARYIAFQMKHAGSRDEVFSEDAIRAIFQASQGRPRQINQLAVHGLIHAATVGRDAIDGAFMATRIKAHPLYER